MIARIVTFYATNEISYIGCKTCKKKLVDGYCGRCECEEEGVRAYSFSMQVSDGIGAFDVHVFNKEGEELIGITAEEFKRIADPSERLSSLKRRVSMRNDK